MAFYRNPAHAAGIEHSSLGRGQQPEQDKAILDMESISEASSSERVNVFVVFVFILELLVLIFVCVLEFFLRFTEVFPVRHVTFSCDDPSISYTTPQGTSSYEEFAYNAVVPFVLVISLCFCLPPFIMIIGEIALWAFTEERQKTVRILCRQCPMPQVIRRIIRYIGTFLFGLIVTMIFTDVIKIMVGRLRPNFLEICRPNLTMCLSGDSRNQMFDDEICTSKDPKAVREGKLSFPSMHAAMTAFSAIYLAIYLHHTIRAHSVRVMRPFASLAFVMLSILCCLSRYGLNESHWEDVAFGFLLGAVLAIYMGVFSLNNFREHMRSRTLYTKLRHFLAEQRAVELRDLYKEDRLDRISYFGIPAYSPGTIVDSYTYNGHMAIPRPHMRNGHSLHDNESTTDPVSEYDRRDKYRRHDTFQRDLHRTLDQFSSSQPPPSSHHKHQRAAGGSYGHM